MRDDDLPTLDPTLEATATGVDRLVGGPLVAAGVVLAWVAVGVAVALHARRRGHDARPWVGLGLALGPLSLPLLRAHRSRRVEPLVVAPGSGGDGGSGGTVLVAVLGDPLDAADVDPLLRSRTADDVVLCRAVTPEAIAATDPTRPRDTWDPSAAAAAADLERAALLLPSADPRLVLLPGAPNDAVRRHAAAIGADPVVVLGEPRQQRGLARSGDRTMVVTSPAEARGDLPGRDDAP